MPPKKAAAGQGVKRKAAASAEPAATATAEPAAVKRAKSKDGATEPTLQRAKSKAGTAAVNLLLSGLSDAGWRKALAEEFEKPYFEDIAQFVESERASTTVHPPVDQVFTTFNVTPFSKVKVVILGQDPYHEPGQAHGLCFSVLPGIKTPPSLKNMYRELETDIPGFKDPDHGHLLAWAKQGILMLNATLTVREGHDQANSHSKCGWQKFTDEAIRALNKREGIVFLLFGGFAQKKGKIIDQTRHKVIECAHPSPLSVTKWRGCKVFSKCNAELVKLKEEPINWLLDAPTRTKSGDIRSLLGATKK